MVLSAAPLHAALKIQIQPIRVELEGKRSASITVINHDARDAVLEARAFGWRQQIDGKDVLTSTGDVIVTPPIMRIPPGASQTVRLGLAPGVARPAEGREGSYRLVLEELPESVVAAQSVGLRMRYVLPVFVRNGRNQAGPVDLRSVGAESECRIVAENRGARHVRVEGLRVRAGGQEFEVEVPLYVLAGTRLELGCPAGMSGHDGVENIWLEGDAGTYTDTGGADDASRQ